MIFPVDAFEDFCAQIRIASKETGLVPLVAWGTQRRLTEEIAAGLERDIHHYVVLKGRQVGITTRCNALSLWWLQRHAGMQGMLVAEEDGNRDYLRDVIRQMLDSLAPAYRYPVVLDNQNQLRWEHGSRLMFAAAGKRTGSNLGRSRGINYYHGTEMGSWVDQQAASALHAALSEKNPHRLYIEEGTARGFNTFHEMWTTAEKAVAQKAVFIGWFLREDYTLVKAQKALWRAYAAPPHTSDERDRIRAVQRESGVKLTPGQWGWYRYQLRENFYGDETMLAQEHPCTSSEAFQAFGDRFISAPILQRLRLDADTAPRAKGYRYEWGETFDATRVVPCDPADAPLVVWEEPDPVGVYVVAGHPAFSSGQDAPGFVAQVWRVWPDRAVQVAEYHADEGALYTFAWLLLHLCATYSTTMRAYLIHEVGYTGQQVLGELQRIERYSYGLSPSARRTPDIANLVGNIRHYLYYRVDTLRQNPAYHVKMTESLRPFLLNALRDEIERRHLTLRSAPLLDELAMLRRGEHGDSDQIGGGGGAAVERVITAAYAVECWLKAALPDLESVLAPAVPPERPERRVEEMLVQGFFARLGGGG